MTSFWKRLACILVGTAIYPTILLVSVVIQYAQTVLPPGIDHTLKLRVCQTWLISGILLGIVLEALGLSSLPEILRLWTNGIGPREDPSLVIRNQNFDGVPVRIYSSKTGPTVKGKAVLFCHGGAGVFGSFDSYERFLRYIAKVGNSTVFMVGYRLGPENPYPTQHVECLKAAVFLMKHAEDYGVDSSRIIISGDSFGGAVATHVCQSLVDRSDLPKVHAQVLIYPVLQGLDLCLPSYQQNRRSPLLWRKLVPFLACCYFNKPTSFVDGILKNRHVPEATRLKYQKWVSADHIPERFKARGYTPPEPSSSHFNPRLHEEVKVLLTEMCSPLLAEDAVVSKLPRTFLLTCEYDVLRDDGLLYMRRLTDNRVPVTWSHVEKGIHGMFLLYGYRILSFPLINRVVHDLADFIRSL
ncbi:arylacetamide deacetylase-like 4 [Ahaetulla prasina]|uniref:arylacetamide deacetylase-like 4 n=1 Tax=Ahaetulla prasina TaxID=499056 RepID=UPI002649E4DD|nr:arylacetamide deacetylase-like 4 [Ahaetulla prasina]